MDCYELAPSGETWPATLAGLTEALDACIMIARSHPDITYNLNRIESGIVRTIRIYTHGEPL